MRFADLTYRIAGESIDTWDVHYRAMERLDAGEDIYLMSVGQESDAFSPAGVMNAAVDSIRAGRHHYTAVQGDSSLRRAIARRYEKNFARDIDPDSVVVFAGAQNALFATAQVLLQPGDEVILIEPYYTTYPATFSASGADLVSVVLAPEEQFQLQADRVLDAITDRTRAIVVNTPNNPTGAVYTRAPLQTLVDVCRQRGIWLIADEVYVDIVAGEVCRVGALPGAEDVVVSISSVSKSHRMTGWRIGWAVGPRALADHYYNLNMCMSYGLPGFTQDAAIYALECRQDVARDVASQLVRRRQIVLAELGDAAGVTVHGGGGGMFVILDIRDLGMNSMQFATGLLDAEGVSVQPLTGFGKSCEGLVRVSAVLQEDRLREACRRMVGYIASARAHRHRQSL